MRARALTAHERALVEGALVAARQLRPYYARALSALTPIAADGLGTVAVDVMWRLYVDPVWFGKLPLEQRAGVLAAHEVEHLLRDHSGRARVIAAEGPAWQAWQVAADAEINDDAGAGEALPPHGVTPASLGCAVGLLAEEYYEHVTEHARGSCGGGSGAGAPLPGELAADQGDGLGADEVARLRADVAADVREYAASSAQARGEIPARVIVWAEALAPSAVRVAWPRVLRAALTRIRRSCSRGVGDWTWTRPSRRPSPHVIRPATIVWRPRVGVVVDTSGSMGDRGGDVLAVVRGAARACGDLRIWQVDAEIHGRSRRFRAGLEYRGGGGTDLRPAIAEAAASSDLVIAVTDAETPWPDEAPPRPVVVVTWPGAATVPSWATRVDIDPEAAR